MAVPSVSLTYQYSANNVLAAGGSTLASYQNVLFGIKNALKAFATLPWTVSGSSNSVAAAMDATDRWASASNLVWNTPGNAISWIVLKNTGIAANFQLCIGLTASSSTAGYQFDLTFSPANGFTGGSTTSRPSATDEVAHLGIASWMGNFGGAFSSVYHVTKATTGAVTRIIVCSGGVVVGWFCIEKAVNSVTGWTLPLVITSMSNTQSTTVNHSTYTNLYDTNGNSNGYLAPSTILDMHWTSESVNNAAVGRALPVANDFSGETYMAPINLACTTGTKRGRHGSLSDIWWGRTPQLPGATYPADTTRTFATFGDVIIPWNGSVPLYA